MSSSLTLNCSA